MSTGNHIPEHLKYMKSHEWVLTEDDGTVVIGITDYAQEMLGDLVYVELPEVGQVVTMGTECATVESVKSASDIYSPVNGEVVAVNEVLADEPEKVNQSPYHEGWLFKVKPADETHHDVMLDAERYQAALTEDNA